MVVHKGDIIKTLTSGPDCKCCQCDTFSCISTQMLMSGHVEEHEHVFVGRNCVTRCLAAHKLQMCCVTAQTNERRQIDIYQLLWFSEYQSIISLLTATIENVK